MFIFIRFLSGEDYLNGHILQLVIVLTAESLKSAHNMYDANFCFLGRVCMWSLMF